MKSTAKIRKLQTIVNRYQQRVEDALSPKGTDERARVLKTLIASLANCVRLHYELQALEKKGRVTISKKDIASLSKTHYSALGMFMELANPSKTSLYELSVILALADVVAAHEEKPET